MAKIRGPKPQPTAIKRLRGNPGRRKLNENEPAAIEGEPQMPDHLSPEAQATWRWLVDTLRQMGILAKSDVAIMAMYCETWTEYVKIRRDVNKHGFLMISPKTGLPFANPQINIESMFKKQLTHYLCELGLSAPSRTRLTTKSNEEETDPITVLLSQRYGQN